MSRARSRSRSPHRPEKSDRSPGRRSRPSDSDSDDSSASSSSASSRSSSSSSRSSTSSSSSSSSSDSDSEAERARRKKEKRRRERKKEKKAEKKARRKEKEKEKKKLKKKKRVKSVALTDQWGKFGVISETDIYSKAEEYNSWLLDVKGLNREILTNREEKEHFRQFMEDFNTGTFPSKKYYDIRAWDAREVNKKNKALEKQRRKLSDEERLRMERIEAAERRSREADAARIQIMKDAIRQKMVGEREAAKTEADLKRFGGR